MEAKILRDGKEQTISVTTEARTKGDRKGERDQKLGHLRDQHHVYPPEGDATASQDGVIVTGILPSGPAGAAKPALREGDVIVRVGGEPIKDIIALREMTRKLIDGKTDTVPILVHFDRRQKHLATVIKVGKNDFSKPSIEIAKAWLGVDTQVITRDLAEGLAVRARQECE